MLEAILRHKDFSMDREKLKQNWSKIRKGAKITYKGFFVGTYTISTISGIGIVFLAIYFFYRHYILDMITYKHILFDIGTLLFGVIVFYGGVIGTKDNAKGLKDELANKTR
jgi:hypothetical protein